MSQLAFQLAQLLKGGGVGQHEGPAEPNLRVGQAVGGEVFVLDLPKFADRVADRLASVTFSFLRVGRVEAKLLGETVSS